MAESPQPGTPSSKHLPATKSEPVILYGDAADILNQIASSPLFQRIHQSLGEDAALHIVGGGVRDAFLGEKKSDLDIASKHTPQQAKLLLEGAGFHIVETGIEHGTIVIALEDQNIELTTFRAPSAREETRYSETIEEDLRGRDFTINAVAFSVTTREVIDPFNGIKDLEAGILRAVDDPTCRFQEDPLRVLRAIRFGPAAGRTVDAETLRAAKNTAPLLEKISPERIRDELVKILCAPYPTEALECMDKLALFQIILPEILPSIGCEQNEFHIHDVYEHTLWVIERAENTELLRLAALFHDLGKPATVTVDEQGRRHFYKHEQVSEEIAQAVMKRLRFPKKITRDVSTLVRHHMRPLDCGPSGLRRIMRDLGDLFDDWLLFKRADMPPVMPQEEFEQIYKNFMKMLAEENARTALPEYGHLAVNGNDLIAVGIPSGKELGRILKALEETVIDTPEKNTKESLLRIARELQAQS